MLPHLTTPARYYRHTIDDYDTMYVAALLERGALGRPIDSERWLSARLCCTGRLPQVRLLAPEVIQAWEKTGAVAGWFGKDEDDSLVFRVRLGDGLKEPVPAFELREWERGVLEKLPVPETPFGLSLNGTSVGDADLKELARLESLRAWTLGTLRSQTRV